MITPASTPEAGSAPESKSATAPHRVAVLGGGIAGLVAAFDLARAGVDVSVHEASERIGGKVWTSPVGDRMVDAGADTFLARVPQGRQLCADLGLADELTSPVAPVPAYLHRDGALHRLPADTVVGVPTDVDALAPYISAEGIARAAEDLTRPATPLEPDVTVGAYFRDRFGDEVTDRLIDPLIGGINASDIDELSLSAAVPQIAAAASSQESIMEALRSMRARIGATLGSTSTEPVFFGLPGGIARIATALGEAIGNERIQLDSAPALAELDADKILIATPAKPAAALLRPVSPRTADLLERIPYASVAQVTVEFAAEHVSPHLDASGVLFPRCDGQILTACTWFSTKWTHYQRPGRVLLRMTSGRFGDERALELDDAELTARLISDLGAVVSITGEPTAIRVHRWLDALPQYVPGHRANVDAIVRTLAEDAPHIALAGAAYRGIGIPATIESGRSAATSLLR